MIIAQFSEAHYTVNEGGPAVQICIDITDGLVGAAGLTINVQSIAGGTAECKRYVSGGADQVSRERDLYEPLEPP